MTSDFDLLGQFAREKSQDAFTALVSRHVNLVYSAALRKVRSPQLAEEIAQSVFADLARNAGSLAGGGDASSPKTLTPWLYAVTRRTAIDVIRKESRRQLREQIAVELTNMNATPDDWTQIEPLLDDAMAALEETDRSAILLRYFENKTLREVGETLGTSDDTAQKRVSRAVERLREFFSKRNVTIGAGGLAVVISTNAVQAAPMGLAATISAAAVLAGTAVSTSTAIAATKTIAMTTTQKILVTAALAVVAGAGIYEARQAAQLRDQIQTLQQQQAPLMEQVQQLQHERDVATNMIAGLKEELAQSAKNNFELLKLRSEITLLKRRTAGQPIGDNESWRNPAVIADDMNALNMVRTNVPQVILLDSKYDRDIGYRAFDDSTEYKYDVHHNLVSRITSGWRGIGLGIDASNLLMLVYDSKPQHTIFSTNMPDGRFDFIANMRQGSRSALQEEIRNKLGITGTKVEVGTNAYALVLHDSDLPVYHETNMFGGVKIDYWVNTLEGLYHAPVINLTGLTNYYVSDCNFYRPVRQTDEEFTQIVLARIREQLGLELIATNLPIDMLMVEKVK